MSGLLVHSPAHIVSRILVAKGQTAEPGSSPWPIYVGTEPDKPDNCVTVKNTTGRDFGFTQTDGRMLEMPGIQIRVRGSTENVAHERARRIAVSLDEGVEDQVVTIDETVYLVHCLDRVGGVISLGREQQARRNLFTVNFVLTVSVLSTFSLDTPAELPTEYQRAWYRVAPGYLWQNTSRTTPAAADGDRVRVWDDSWGGFHAVAPNDNARPTLRIIGSNWWLETSPARYFVIPDAAFTPLTEAEILTVCYRRLPANSSVWNLGGSGTSGWWPFGSEIYDDAFSTIRRNFTPPSFNFDVPHSYGVRSAAGDWKVYLDGREAHTTTTNTFARPGAGNALLGNNGVAGDHYIGETILCKRLLTVYLRGALYGYLTRYLAAPLSLLTVVEGGRASTIIHTGATVLSGTATIRAEFTSTPQQFPGSLPGQWTGNASQSVSGAFNHGQLVIGGHPWAGLFGPDEYLNDRFDQNANPPFYEGDCDTTVFGDGCYPALYWISEYGGLTSLAHNSQYVYISNRTADRTPVPANGVAGIHVQPSGAISLPSLVWVKCNGTTGGAVSSPSWSSSDPLVATTSAALSDTHGGEVILTATASNKKGRIRAWVQNNATQYLPHFKINGGGVATTYNAATSRFFTFFLNLNHVELEADGTLADTLWNAGVNAASIDFAVDPRDFATLAAFQTGTDNVYNIQMNVWLADGRFHFAAPGDAVARDREIFSAYLYPTVCSYALSALTYYINKWVTNARCVVWRGMDETGSGYGSDPHNITSIGQGGPQDLIDNTSIDTFYTRWRAVANAPPISWGGGGRLWSIKNSIADATDVYGSAPIDDGEADPERGYSPDQLRRQWRRAFAGDTATSPNVRSAPTDVPRIALIGTTGPHYIKRAAAGTGQDYDPDIDDIITMGIPAETIIAQVGLAAVHRCCAVGMYLYDSIPVRSERLSHGSGYDAQTGIHPSQTERWAALSAGLNWFKTEEARLLSPPVPAPHFGEDWETFARDGGVGKRIVGAVNFSGIPQSPPATPSTPAGLGSPWLLSTTGYAALGDRRIPNGCVVVWFG